MKLLKIDALVLNKMHKFRNNLIYIKVLVLHAFLNNALGYVELCISKNLTVEILVTAF